MLVDSWTRHTFGIPFQAMISSLNGTTPCKQRRIKPCRKTRLVTVTILPLFSKLKKYNLDPNLHHYATGFLCINFVKELSPPAERVAQVSSLNSATLQQRLKLKLIRHSVVL